MPIDDLIDALIEACGGDVHAAMKALLLINKRLEAALADLYQQHERPRRADQPTLH